MVEKPQILEFKPKEVSIMHIYIQVNAYTKWYRTRNQFEHLRYRLCAFLGFICGDLFED